MKMTGKQRASFIAGICLIMLTLLPALIGAFHTPADPDAVNRKLRLSGSVAGHLFGTDHLGRDVLSRVITGTGTTFLVAFFVVLIGGFFGIIIGAVTGYFGGIVDEIIMRLNDALASFPSVLLAMLSVAVFGTSTKNTVLVLGVLFIPSFARVTRSEFLREKEKDYVKNIRLQGASHGRIMFKHILPNTRESLLSAIAIGINNAILAESSMSYLGLGVQPPTASLGRMMSEGQTYIKTAPWITFWPGIAIIVTVMGFALLSDSFGNRKVENFGFFTTLRLRKAMSEFIKGDVDEDVEEEMTVSGNTGVLARAADGVLAGNGTENGDVNHVGVSVSDESTSSRKEIEKAAAAEQQEDTVKTLQVKNLHIVVDETPVREVVKGIDFHVNKGEILGIVGESGSGKSFSASAILGIINGRGLCSTSTLTLEGRSIAGISEREFRKIRGSEIAMVFQEPMTALDPSKKIGRLMRSVVSVEKYESAGEKVSENAIESADEKITVDVTESADERVSADKKLSKKQKKLARIKELLLEVGLEDTDRILNSYPGELSGGQRQRVLIAMAIANNPKLLICDEPTTALDKDVSDKIIELIRKLHDEKKMSVVFISHDIEITRNLCDRIIIMKDGKIVERGKADVITDAPKTEYAAELIRASEGRDYKKIVEEERAALDGNGGAPSTASVEKDETPSATSKDSSGSNEKAANAFGNKTQNESIIAVKNLSVSYPLPHGKKLEVLKDLSFEVKKGETLGISGASGSGKTTVLKALTKMTPYTGDVKIAGRCAMVFQDPFSSLNPSMRVYDMLREVLVLEGKRTRKAEDGSNNESGVDINAGDGAGENTAGAAVKNMTDGASVKERISAMMESVGLDDSYLDHYPHELSGGQRQRVAIAMAFITNPDIVFLDEPVTALDVTIQDRIMTLLAKLKGRYNMTIVMISHDGKLLSNFCDRVMKIS